MADLSCASLDECYPLYSVEEDISFSRRLPHDHPALVEIVLNSGKTLVGDVDNPISYEELEYKFSSLTSAIFPNGDVSQA